MPQFISKTIVSFLMFVLFSMPFVGMVMTYSSQEVKTMTATIVSFNIPTGKITFKDDVSNTVVMEAGSEIDLKTFQKGEEVRVAYESGGIVKAMSRP